MKPSFHAFRKNPNDLVTDSSSHEDGVHIDFLSDIDKQHGTKMRKKLDQMRQAVNNISTTENNNSEEGNKFIKIIPDVVTGGYDVIGDIHGHAKELEHLLVKLDYKKINGIWCHNNRVAVFVGDYIDKGPKQMDVFNIVRGMVDSGSAMAIMGNHEFNAVAWATPDKLNSEQYLRPHTDKNHKQTADFLEQTHEGSVIYKEIIEWFSRLPLFLDLPGFRVIHAYWSDEHIEILRPYLDKNNAIQKEAWQKIAKESSAEYPAIEKILKGPETELPEGVSFFDVYNHERTCVRVKWWVQGIFSYQHLAMVHPDERTKIPDMEIKDPNWEQYQGVKPVFFGHYTFLGTPSVLSDKVCCVDFSITDKTGEGKLCCYRWNEGDKTLTSENLIWVSKEKCI